MTAQPPQPPASSGFGIADILFLVFRHKWKIVIGLILGFCAGGFIFVRVPRVYGSEAKILVRYVSDRAMLNPASRDDTVRSPDAGGQTIINSEIQILTSRDLLEDVVRIIGPDKIVVGNKVAGTAAEATTQIGKNLTVDPPARSSVISISYQHPDPAIAQKVLKVLLERYTEKHAEIHRALGAYEFLSTQTDRLRQQLMQTEAELRNLRTNAGIVSVDAAKTGLAAQMTQLKNTILQQEAELAGRRAILPPQTNSPAIGSTNIVSLPPPPENANLYKTIRETLDSLRVKEMEMSSQYTDAHPVLQSVRAQISDLAKRKRDMESANPQLLAIPRLAPNRDDRKEEAENPAIEVAMLEARLNVLRSQWERLRGEAAALDNAEVAIKELERRKIVEEENYKAFATSLEKARIDQAIDASKLSSISVVQSASEALPARRNRTKPVGMAVAGGLAFGLLLAALFEFIIDPTVKRPGELRRARVPLVLTIPALSRSTVRNRRALKDPASSDVTHIDTVPEVSSPSHPMRPWFDALRDRMLVAFDGVLHKPKLVGVTGCSLGAGASSIAAGLAASLSETGDGNVLLVDLNFEQGEAHQFFKGRAVCGLQDALETQKRDSGMAQENLYLASINETNGSGPLVPSKKIAEMLPKLRTSDYDYIIFDLPPITPTSITFRMAGLMDKVLLVAESEKTRRDALSSAHALLKQAKADVGAVLNRQRLKLPAFLDRDLAGSESN